MALSTRTSICLLGGWALLSSWTLAADPNPPLPGTAPWDLQGDPAAEMVSGIDRYLDAFQEQAVKERAEHWPLDTAVGSRDPLGSAVETNRTHLKRILGVVDQREEVRMEFIAPSSRFGYPTGTEIGLGPGYRIMAVRWNVFRGVHGEGLLLLPHTQIKANIIALPDCEWTPEQLVGLDKGLEPEWQFARRFAEHGCRVLVPCLITRSSPSAGSPGARSTQHSQRETLWRAGYEMGRTPAGYEIQKVLAAADWLIRTKQGSTEPESLDDWLRWRAKAPKNLQSLGIVGYGEGGRIAFCAAALDPRFKAIAISGYFGPRNRLHEEPIDRNVWSLLRRFGDAEIGRMILPRPLFLEYGKYPEATLTDAQGGAPGQLRTPAQSAVELEYQRLRQLGSGEMPANLINSPAGIMDRAIAERFYRELQPHGDPLPQSLKTPPSRLERLEDDQERQNRQYAEILEDTQWLMRESEYTRRDFWKAVDRSNAQSFVKSSESYRKVFQEEVVGMIPQASLPANPRTRFLYETNGYRGYEVLLDVHPNIFATGILLIPTHLKPGERRPVVVCQHGLEGRPRDVADPSVNNPAYNQYACRLAEQGFVTFAPQNPYIGGTRFRQLLRKSQPLGLTLWSFIVRQHEVITDWLAAQEYVDPDRIAFYGLSYGGKTAMRVPVLVNRYCLSICSADYNEWILKNTSARSPYSYLWTVEYDMPEWNLGNTFNYAELSWLIFPRPFMVERGHDDGVAPDEWVAYEYAKTRRHYVKLGMGNRSAIEFFDGPHSIHGKGTFDFLHRHLGY